LKAAAADKMRAVKAWKLTETIETPDGAASTVTTYVQLPDRMRMETVVARPDGKTSALTVVSGDRGWGKAADGTVTELSRAAVDARKQLLGFDAYRQVLTLDAPGYAVGLLPGRAVGGRPADVVEVARKGADTRVYLFDRATGRLVRREITTRPGGTESTQVMDYLDYREVGGVPVAHRRTAARAGRPSFEVRMDELRYFDRLDDKLFARPE
jgi:outer membrane lipoprotein-sorting protein